jgi:signal peptidase
MDGGAFALPPAAPAAGDLARPAPGRRWPGRAAGALLALALLLAALVGAGAALGLRIQVVLTGSMAPALAPDDMLIVERISAGEMRVGDIVSFAAPGQQDVVITHRVRGLAAAPGGGLAVETRGDANNTSERWTIPRDGVVARVEAVVPALGSLTRWARDPAIRLAVFALLGALLAWLGLRWVWGR